MCVFFVSQFSRFWRCFRLGKKSERKLLQIGAPQKKAECFRVNRRSSRLGSCAVAPRTWLLEQTTKKHGVNIKIESPPRSHTQTVSLRLYCVTLIHRRRQSSSSSSQSLLLFTSSRGRLVWRRAFLYFAFLGDHQYTF